MDFSLDQHTDVDLDISVTDRAGVAVDLTGFTAGRFIVTAHVDIAPADAELTKTLGSGLVITDAATGLITVTLTGANTGALRGAYYYQVNMTDASSKESHVLDGILTVNPAVDP